ncbi:MAG: hypothetical protein ACPHN2_04670 [Sinimarinibacterium flocculans]|uniref:hypothetical protein n=1 Tax=Sinimarinibacterium flocculans TaxID=985250 RepID=UPI003C666DD9
MSAQNRPRLGVLRSELPDMAALTLQSFADTHRDVFTFDDLDFHTCDGYRAVSGIFTHLPTGRPYVIAVVAVPELPEA